MQVFGIEPRQDEQAFSTSLFHLVKETVFCEASQVSCHHGYSTTKRKGSFETNILPLTQANKLILVVHLAV
jgi:hypothetical protein